MVRHIETTLARSMYNCDEGAAYSATSLAFRDRLVITKNSSQLHPRLPMFVQVGWRNVLFELDGWHPPTRPRLFDRWKDLNWQSLLVCLRD